MGPAAGSLENWAEAVEEKPRESLHVLSRVTWTHAWRPAEVGDVSTRGRARQGAREQQRLRRSRQDGGANDPGAQTDWLWQAGKGRGTGHDQRLGA